ncbi:MAG: AbrB/MazE/SpoVT family DNA-binding domain-containing protein [Armatimonadetes bacterium]|nr:AbrB/MazE/SpoVT family DNA-binding domain-containing protein [Armatimonadota bacterium]
MEQKVREREKAKDGERVYRVKVGERGQITIPKALRDRYGLKKGVEVEVAGDRSVLRVRRAADIREAVAALTGTVVLDVTVDEFIEETRGR